jgi:hypothetical protein
MAEKILDYLDPYMSIVCQYRIIHKINASKIHYYQKESPLIYKFCETESNHKLVRLL